MKGGYGSITEEMIRMLGSFSWFSCTVLIHSEKRKKKEKQEVISHTDVYLVQGTQETFQI